MILLLWILISLAVGLVVVVFIPSKGRLVENSEVGFQNKTEFAIEQLKERVFSLENESSSVNKLCASIKEDLSHLKENDLASIIKLLEKKEGFKQKVFLPAQESGKLQEYEKTIEFFKKEIEGLSHKLIDLTLEIKRLEEEEQKKDRCISELKRKEIQARRVVEEVKLRLKKTINELSDVKTRELKLRADLFKEKVVYSDNEKELERLTRENEELKDGLSYEMHN
ncbi:MAG: hypothetical protein KAS05_02860 [Candidatus Omnitrophica bacterium]|nr:hypothetical protein [Candidatus Omnitrophota bacterium]